MANGLNKFKVQTKHYSHPYVLEDMRCWQHCYSEHRYWRMLKVLNFFRRCSCPADTFSMIYLRLSSKQSSQLFARKMYSALCISTIKEDARVFVLVNQNSKKIPYPVFESSFSLSIMICIPLSMNCFANKNTVHTGAKNISLYWTKTLSFHYLRHKRH